MIGYGVVEERKLELMSEYDRGKMDRYANLEGYSGYKEMEEEKKSRGIDISKVYVDEGRMMGTLVYIDKERKVFFDIRGVRRVEEMDLVNEMLEKGMSVEEIKDEMGKSSIDVYDKGELKESINIDIVEYIRDDGVEIGGVVRLRDRLERTVGDLEARGEYYKIMGVIDQAYHPMLYKEIKCKLSDKERYEILKHIYISSEDGLKGVDYKEFEAVLERGRNEKKVGNLPYRDGYLRVYRGVHREGQEIRDGISWTISKEVAERFAHGYGVEGQVYKGYVKKENVLDYFTERNEKEVIVRKGKIEGTIIREQ